MTNPIRVMLVDDHDVVRRGLAVFLRAFKDMTLVGEATDGAEAVRLCEVIQPDVILMDMIMPNMGGLEATKAIRKAHPDIQIIALTSYTDEELQRTSLAAGAAGYLFKDTSINELAAAIYRAASLGHAV